LPERKAKRGKHLLGLYYLSQVRIYVEQQAGSAKVPGNAAVAYLLEKTLKDGIYLRVPKQERG